jgi:hypothetical protein
MNQTKIPCFLSWQQSRLLTVPLSNFIFANRLNKLYFVLSTYDVLRILYSNALLAHPRGIPTRVYILCSLLSYSYTNFLCFITYDWPGET